MPKKVKPEILDYPLVAGCCIGHNMTSWLTAETDSGGASVSQDFDSEAPPLDLYWTDFDSK